VNVRELKNHLLALPPNSVVSPSMASLPPALHGTQKLFGNARSRQGQPESGLSRVLKILLSNGVLKGK
jgi:hypothetical protein